MPEENFIVATVREHGKKIECSKSISVKNIVSNDNIVNIIKAELGPAFDKNYEDFPKSTKKQNLINVQNKQAFIVRVQDIKSFPQGVMKQTQEALNSNISGNKQTGANQTSSRCNNNIKNKHIMNDQVVNIDFPVKPLQKKKIK